jgi:hypothetical protein
VHVYGVLKGLINGATDASGLDVYVINLIRLARRTFLMIKNKVESILCEPQVDGKLVLFED